MLGTYMQVICFPVTFASLFAIYNCLSHYRIRNVIMYVVSGAIISLIPLLFGAFNYADSDLSKCDTLAKGFLCGLRLFSVPTITTGTFTALLFWLIAFGARRTR